MKELITLFILCAASITVISAQSLTIQLSGSNISCHDARDGAVNLTVSGGTSPYTFEWSNGATTEDIGALPPNYYAVTVTDAASNTATDGITITEPAQIIYQFTTSDYVVNGTHYNLSSYTWHNGSISTNVAGGVSPYTYLWSNSATTANISSLDAGSYRITITDATSCSVISDGVALTKPDRSDWTMSGNASTDPSSQFIGTTDAQDLSFRTNNQEALRLKTNGKLKINSLADTLSYSPVIVDSSGQLRSVNATDDNLDAAIYNATPWLLGGNTLPGYASDNYLGTKNSKPLIFKTNSSEAANSERMRITPDGKVGIGTSDPSQKFEVKHNDTDGGIAINKTGTPSKKSEIKFNHNGNQKWAIGNDHFNTGDQTFFIWDHAASRTRLFIDQNGKTFIGFGANSLPCSGCSGNYRLFVEGGIMTRDVKVTATTPFPDYVFNKGYKLMSIYELEQFIKQNKHLPGIPSAKEIEKNDGYELGDMVQKLLQKTEEQSLYIIDLQKQIDKLNVKIENLIEK